MLKTKNDVCVLASRCKFAGIQGMCNALCSPYLVMHGDDKGGVWRTTNVPKKYKGSFVSNLPIQKDNPDAYQFITTYGTSALDYVREGVGLFLYSVPNAENKLGTGTGKTTSAIALLHQYLIERVIEDSKGINPITVTPAFFYKASELQTLYNAQFRGTPSMQESASIKYYKIKRVLMTAELLVFDDIGIRQKITDAFENELTEIIDHRDSEALTTFYTSNLPISELQATLGSRIASRLEGMTEQVAFVGKDNRKGGVLK